MQSDSPGSQDWTVFSASRVCKRLPGGLSTPATQSGIYNEIMGLPFDPMGCVQREFFSFSLKRKKKTLAHSSLHLSLHRQHQEQWLILLRQCSITGPVVWQWGRLQISTTCTALKSKESALAVWPHSWGRRREKKCKQRSRRGEKPGRRSEKQRGRK